MPTLKRTTKTFILRQLAAAMLVLLTLTSYTQIPKLNSYPLSSATIYLDFDGQFVKGTAWNWDSSIHALPAKLSSSLITEVFNRTAEDFRIFNLNITTDSNVYRKATVTKRMRIIITPTSEWYGNDAAGISFVNSFSWGDDTPAWVFSNLLDNNPKFIAEATSHEIGHTLGLQHQSTYTKDCGLVDEYGRGKGSGEIGWAPIMGAGYFKNMTLWTVGQSIEGCSVIQNDISIISKGLSNIGFRSDDYGNLTAEATTVIFSENNFQSQGIINNAADRDVFKLQIPRRMKVNAKVTPSHVASNNSGANVDLFLSLLNKSGETIGRYNPRSLLNASFDTTLPAGTYYMEVDGTSNQNVSDYGSVGLYTFTGSVENLEPATTVLLRGDVRNRLNVIQWNIEAGTPVRTTYLEFSTDGTQFRPITRLPLDITAYTDHYFGGSQVFYRVKVVLEDETTAYSNVISLQNADQMNVLLLNNPAKGRVFVKSSGDYTYQLFDVTGRLSGKGKLNAGINTISFGTGENGVYILKVFNHREQFHYRIIKQ